MAEPFAHGDTRRLDSGDTIRAEAQSAADYQIEIEKLREDMARLAQVVSGSVRDSVRPLARELEATVVRNPTASIAIAAGAGLLLGFLLSRK